MAQYHPSKAITGNFNLQKQMYTSLKDSFMQANSIDLVVSFIMESGVRLMLKYLKQAVMNGGEINLLTGTYLNITQPGALYLLKRELGNHIHIYFYKETNQSFHPKAYFFHYSDYDEVYIGSSNISFSALTSGIEWNYRFTSKDDEENYQNFIGEYHYLLAHSYEVTDEVLKEYSKSWKQSALEKDIQKLKETTLQTTTIIQPNGVQTEALYELEKTRKEGSKRALVCAATGIGKTYLAAFDSLHFKRILFVAHREEILKQAYKSFKVVRNSNDMGFFMGGVKETEYSIIFANVATLGKLDYLNSNYFTPDYFDYIVVDEFHHAVNNQYMNIINYFKPQFLLGLTATPERMDGRNIFSICNYNVPCEISLKEAINKGILSPFRYYGIYDSATDYNGIRFDHGKYKEEDLNRLYIDNLQRAELIYHHYKKYKNKRTLAFCASTKHAKYMAMYFKSRGINATAIYSNSEEDFNIGRFEAIDQLNQHQLDIIFSVDMFNEGLDVPSIDLVLFLRPTESATVFIQQLGRGLRKEKDKEYLTVLDFIGNYKNVNMIPHLLSCSYSVSPRSLSEMVYPDGCIVDFDFKAIDLFNESKVRINNQSMIIEEIKRIYDLLGHIPSRVDLFNYMDEEIYQLSRQNKKYNILYHYHEYLQQLNLNSNQFDENTSAFLDLIASTAMSKSYKMPVLKSFYQDNTFHFEVDEAQLLKSWKEFYSINKNYQDLTGVQTYEDYNNMSDHKHLRNILNNPVNFLIQSSNGAFVKGENGPIAIGSSIQITDTFIQEYIDIIEYRTLEYYKKIYGTNTYS